MKAPWFKFYYKDYAVFGRQMSLEQHGFYLHLMMMSFSNAGPLKWPEDADAIKRSAGVSKLPLLAKLIGELHDAGAIEINDAREIIPFGFSLARRGRKPAPHGDAQENPDPENES